MDDLTKNITSLLLQLDRWSYLRTYLIEENHIDVSQIDHEYSTKEKLADTDTLLLCIYIVKEYSKTSEDHSAGSLARTLCGPEPSSEEAKEAHKKYVKNTQANLTSTLSKIAPYKIINFEKEKKDGDSQERYYVKPNQVLIDFLKIHFFTPTEK